MPETRLETPHLRVRYADGREITVKTDNPDMVYWDLERAKRKWPTGQDAPMLWINYLAYSKLHRSGDIERGTKFEDWLATTAAIDNMDADGEPSDETATVGPTAPGPEPG
jgi:hypothetical protein